MTGVAPALLPLLAEPACAAIQGLAITARRKRPAYTGVFLAALREICTGASVDAAKVDKSPILLTARRKSAILQGRACLLSAFLSDVEHW